MNLSDHPLINAYNMDCMEFMRDKPDNYYDLAIVDPPYGVKRDKGFEGFEGFGGFGKPIARKQYQGEWDSATPDKHFFDELIRVSGVAIIWGGNFFTDKLPQTNHWLFWNKMNTMPTFGDGELAWINSGKNSVKMHTLEYNGLLGKEKDHPPHTEASCPLPMAPKELRQRRRQDIRHTRRIIFFCNCLSHGRVRPRYMRVRRGLF